MAKPALVLALLACLLAGASAYPRYWATEYAPNCNAVPTGPKDCHKAPQADTATTIVVSQGGRPVTSVCIGRTYVITVTYPNARLGFLALSAGGPTTRNALNARCPNTLSSTSPARTMTTAAVAPGAAGTWAMSVTSATGACAPFQVTRASVPVKRC